MRMEEDKDNFTFWFLAGVLIFIGSVLVGVLYLRASNELEYQRPEVQTPKGDTSVVPPVWECPEGKDCKG